MFLINTFLGGTMHYKIHDKEKLYLTIMAVISPIAFAALCYFHPQKMMLLYAAIAILLINCLGRLYFIGHLRGNAVKVNEKQFPELYAILKDYSEKLQLNAVPTMYILQGNGILNAFATKFVGKNYVILHSDVLTAAYKEGKAAVAFIIGHELGHIKRNHLSLLKTIGLFPARMVPFLAAAYSRSCEYTCDNIGYALSPEGAEKGMLILAVGNELYTKVNVPQLLHNAHQDKGFAVSFVEIFATHPRLVKRVEMLHALNQANSIQGSYANKKEQETAHAPTAAFESKEKENQNTPN